MLGCTRYLLCKWLPQAQWSEITHLLFDSFCQSGIWAWLAGSSASGTLTRLQVRCQSGLQSNLKAGLEKNPLLSACGCWQDSISCWLLAWCPLFLPHGLSGQQFTNDNLLHQTIKERQSASKREVTVVWDIITEVTSPHLGRNLSVRSKFQGLPALKGRGLTRIQTLGGGDPWGPF